MAKYKYVRKTFTYNGKRYDIKAKTEKEAIRKMVEKQARLRSEEPTNGGEISVKKWSALALEHYKPNVSDKYREQMKYRLERHILPEIGNVPVNKVTPLQCQQILNAQKGMSKSHITKLAQELFFVFDAARKNGLITKNPAADLSRPLGTNNKRRALTTEERKHLLQVIPSDPRFIFFELMLFCGCRPGEAAEVRFEDVTTIEGIPFLHIRGTKTANSDRFVPIPKEMQTKLTAKKKGYVATTLEGNHHNESSYKRMVASLERAMNISMGAKLYRNALITEPLAPDFVPYLLRHTYCTDLKKKGVDLRIAKNLMGHADIRTTANIYDHDDGETLMLAARQMGL